MRRSRNTIIGLVALLASLGLMTGILATSAAVPSNSIGSTNASLALGVTSESDVDIAITSSDPNIINRLGPGSTIRLVEGDRVEFNGTVPDSLRQLPRTLSLAGTVAYGTYTLTINGGSNFDVFRGTVTVNQPNQTLNVELQVSSTALLVDALVEKLKDILRDALGSTPTATPVTPTATPVTPTATPVTPTAMPITPTATPVTPTAIATSLPPTATIVPAARVTGLSVDADDKSLVTGETATFTVTVTGRTGPVGSALNVTYTVPLGLTVEDFDCTGCSMQDGDSATFNYSDDTAYTATLTFDVTADTEGTYVITVTATDSVSGSNLTSTEAVEFNLPPTPTATATAVPSTAPTTFTYQGASCGAANADGEQTCTAMFGQGETEPVTCVSTPTVVCKGEFGDEVVDMYDCVYAAPTGTCILHQ